MTATTKPTRRPLIRLSLPRSSPKLLAFARSILERMTGNPSFPNPAPSVADLTKAIDDLQTAQTAEALLSSRVARLERRRSRVQR
jgi:hypothetical protein